MMLKLPRRGEREYIAAYGIVAVYVETIRNTPLIVQLFLIFFGLPSAGVKFDANTAAMIALSVNLGAYSIEIIRAGLEAIPRSQIEAGQSLGLARDRADRFSVGSARDRSQGCPGSGSGPRRFRGPRSSSFPPSVSYNRGLEIALSLHQSRDIPSHCSRTFSWQDG